MMSPLQHLLLKLIEECGEVSHEASKAMQFGYDSRYPGIPETNREKIHKELDDIAAIVEMLNISHGLGYVPNYDRIDEKKKKVMHYHQQSVEFGFTEEGPLS